MDGLANGWPILRRQVNINDLLADCQIHSYLLSYLHVRLNPFITHAGEVTVAWLRYLNCYIGYLFLPFQVSEVLVLLANKKVGLF